MCIKVMLVDDSDFFMQRFKQILQPHHDIKIVACAANGLEAIRLACKFKPDIISMDYAMPVLDGVQAVRAIMNSCPTKILMLSALSIQGAKITLDALAAGAVDFLPKNELNSDIFVNKIRQLAGNDDLKIKGQNSVSSKDIVIINPAKTRLIIIAASTGGPIAVQRILQQLPRTFSVPIVIIQHMPAAFSAAFAQRLNEVCSLQVIEAQNGDIPTAGKVFIAPGGRQLLFNKNSIRIIDDLSCSYHPSADLSFSSAAKNFTNEVLALVLTGMGQDGCVGAQKLKSLGSKIWAQSRETCTIYGMPAAVINAGLSDEIIHLEQIAPRLIEIFDSK